MHSCVSLAALCRIRGLQAPRGSLDNVVSDIEDGGESIPVPIKLVILQQVTSGMEALVDQKLIHRDLALRNVLVFALDLADAAATSVKVADFGLTVNSYTAGYNYVQGGPKPIRWLAPESLRRGKYSEKSDVWSYGVLAWELLSNGEIPYFGIPSDEGVIQHVIAGNQLARPTEQPCPDPLWSIVTSCWAKLAKDRPTFSRIGIELGAGMMAASSMQMALGMTTRSLWESTDQKGTDQEKLFAVAAANPEHVKVAIDFAKTLPARTIDRIDRVENGYQHEQFSVKVSSIANTIGAAYDEQTMLRYLFHGTREVGTTRINSILNNPTAGFRPLMSGSTTGAIWGDGAYFARDAKYSHDYAATLPTGQKQMFVVQVATGRWTQGEKAPAVNVSFVLDSPAT